jgi:spore maturation protein CgeB
MTSTRVETNRHILREEPVVGKELVDVRILFWEDHEVYRWGLPPALERLGHTVWIPGPHERGRAIMRPLYQRQPDLVLSMGWTVWATDLEALSIIREYCHRYKAIHVYWSTEDPLHTDIWVVPHLQYIQPDVVMTISPKLVEFYQQLGFYAAELPFAAIPELHRPPVPKVETVIDIAMVANLYGDTAGNLRNVAFATLLRPLLGTPWTIGIWGHGWDDAARRLGFQVPPHWHHPAIPFRVVPGLYNCARIVLSPQNDPDQLTSRTFEALGSGGGALLTIRTPGVQRFFVEGRHLLATGSSGETLRLVQQYLADERARRHISAAARQAVLERHTYDHRAAFLLEWVEPLLKAKRTLHTLQHWHGVTRQICRLSTFKWDQSRPGLRPGALTLTFDLPHPPVGYTLTRATLECFADTVTSPGIALCVNDRDSVLDVVYVHADTSSPYPYKDKWCHWDVSAEVSTRLGGVVQFTIVPDDRLAVTWMTPAGQSVHNIVRYQLRAFCPRITLIWKRASNPRAG